MDTNQPKGNTTGPRAPHFELTDDKGETINLGKALADSPVMLVFYPGDFTPVCTAQLCDYRDRIGDFKSLGIQIFGISPSHTQSHAKFSEKYQFPFPLLFDPDNQVAKEYGCGSLFMFGKVSRSVFLVNKEGFISYQYIEPTVLTRRKSNELINAITQLQQSGDL
jgi:thioredoxin-dependent peroxiredoxin